MSGSFALQQYGKALQGLRDVVSKRRDGLRTALIASLLIFCFENFHGDFRLALTNIQSALDLMHNWLASHITSLSRRGFSPHPHIVEDELVAAYARLDVHLMCWIDVPMMQRTSILSYAITAPSPIPSSFTSIMDANYHFEHITNRTLIYLASLREVEEKMGPDGMGRVFDANYRAYVEPPVAAQLRDWIASFSPWLANIRTSDRDFVLAKTLRIYALTLQISLKSAYFPSSTINARFAVFLPEYIEMVSLAESIVLHPSFVKSFVFDSFIVSCLFVLICKCCCMKRRRKVIEILRVMGARREGVWDASMVAEIGEELLRYEEEGRAWRRPNADPAEDGVEWVEVHLQCINTGFMLPAPTAKNLTQRCNERSMKEWGDGKDGSGKERGRRYLLEWVERTMRMDIVSKGSGYRRLVS